MSASRLSSPSTYVISEPRITSKRPGAHGGGRAPSPHSNASHAKRCALEPSAAHFSRCRQRPGAASVAVTAPPSRGRDRGHETRASRAELQDAAAAHQRRIGAEDPTQPVGRRPKAQARVVGSACVRLERDAHAALAFPHHARRAVDLGKLLLLGRHPLALRFCNVRLLRWRWCCTLCLFETREVRAQERELALDLRDRLGAVHALAPQRSERARARECSRGVSCTRGRPAREIERRRETGRPTRPSPSSPRYHVGPIASRHRRIASSPRSAIAMIGPGQ